MYSSIFATGDVPLDSSLKLQYTPLLDMQHHYYNVDLRSISLAGKSLAVSVVSNVSLTCQTWSQLLSYCARWPATTMIVGPYCHTAVGLNVQIYLKVASARSKSACLHKGWWFSRTAQCVVATNLYKKVALLST